VRRRRTDRWTRAALLIWAVARREEQELTTADPGGAEVGHMLIVHLMCGFATGALAASASLALGFSYTGALGFYIVGGSVGGAASALCALALHEARRRSPQGSARPRWLARITDWPRPGR
jgi:hypothetical protein